MSELNVADLVIVVIFAVSCLIGIYRGILREMITLFTWAIAIVLAFIYGKVVGQLFSFVDSDSLKKILGSISVFVTVVVLGIIIKYFVFRSKGVGKPSGFGRLLGAMFGAARAGVIIVLAMLFLTTAKVEGDKLYQGSMLIPKFNNIVDYLDLRIPDKWQKPQMTDAVKDVPVIDLKVEEPNK